MGMGMGIGSMNMMGGGASGVGVSGSGNSVSSGSSNPRPVVGGVSASSYEAARAAHYQKQAGKSTMKKDGGNITNISPMDAMMAGGTGMNNSMSGEVVADGIAMPNFGLSVNPNQHYEMLKLHHMNLLSEIQETTLMMNLYQQQQQGGGLGRMGFYGGGGNHMGGFGNGMVGGGGNRMGSGGNSNFLMGLINQNQGTDGGAVGAGGMGGGGNKNMMPPPQDNKIETQGNDNGSISSASGNEIMEPSSLANSLTGSVTNSVGGASSNPSKIPEERALWLKKLKGEIAQKEKEALDLEDSLGNDKRRNDGNDDNTPSKSKKRMKKHAELTAI